MIPFAGPCCRWKDNIKVNLAEIGRVNVGCIFLLRMGNRSDSYEHDNELSGSILGRKFTA
jgi:hypothetical protein